MIHFLAPEKVLPWRMEQRLKERQEKLDQAKKRTTQRMESKQNNRSVKNKQHRNKRCGPLQLKQIIGLLSSLR